MHLEIYLNSCPSLHPPIETCLRASLHFIGNIRKGVGDQSSILGYNDYVRNDNIIVSWSLFFITNSTCSHSVVIM